MNRIEIGNCPACDPIMSLLDHLLNIGLTIYFQECRDPHFNELHFKLEGVVELESNKISIHNIDGINEKKFICKCHWSIVEIDE